MPPNNSTIVRTISKGRRRNTQGSIQTLTYPVHLCTAYADYLTWRMKSLFVSDNPSCYRLLFPTKRIRGSMLTKYRVPLALACCPAQLPLSYTAATATATHTDTAHCHQCCGTAQYNQTQACTACSYELMKPLWFSEPRSRSVDSFPIP